MENEIKTNFLKNRIRLINCMSKPLSPGRLAVADLLLKDMLALGHAAVMEGVDLFEDVSDIQEPE